MSTPEARIGSEIPQVEIKTGGDHRSGEAPVRLTTGFVNMRGISHRFDQMGTAARAVLETSGVTHYPVKGLDREDGRFDLVVPSKIAAEMKKALQPFCTGDISMMDERQPSGDSNGHLYGQYAGNDKPAAASHNHAGGQIV